ncbi:MAG TPA: hypothetical protein VK601_02080, partial [Kofleriaceae bacterium]|nr:hypothetical protein [Kofleriaceae bacterium]
PTLYNFEKPPVLHELYNYDDIVEVEEDRWEREAPDDVEPSEAAAAAEAARATDSAPGNRGPGGDPGGTP